LIESYVVLARETSNFQSELSTVIFSEPQFLTEKLRGNDTGLINEHFEDEGYPAYKASFLLNGISVEISKSFVTMSMATPGP
jgi:hypothetical protein